MAKAPPIPKEQRSFLRGREQDDHATAEADRRDLSDRSSRGASGNLDQNVRSVHAKTQDR